MVLGCTWSWDDICRPRVWGGGFLAFDHLETEAPIPMKFSLAVVLSLFLSQYVCPFAESESQQHPSNRQIGTNVPPSQIFSRSKSSVVVIVAQSQQEQAQGSGFIVADDTIVTNHHVVQGMKEAFVVFSDGKAQPVLGVVAASRILRGHPKPAIQGHLPSGHPEGMDCCRKRGCGKAGSCAAVEIAVRFPLSHNLNNNILLYASR